MDEREKYLEEAKDYNYECKMYAKCMREIKQRLYVIKQRLAIGSNEKEKMFDTEIICLQFRSIFELIYLSSLAAHQKLYTKGYDKLKREWSKATITKFLEKKNPNFYPTPVSIKIEKLKDDYINIDLENMESDYLTKDELNIFYNACSDYIHPRNPFAEDNDYKIWLLFPEWFEKIIKLLEAHVVNMFESKRGLFVHINFAEEPENDDIHMAYLVSKKKIIIGN